MAGLDYVNHPCQLMPLALAVSRNASPQLQDTCARSPSLPGPVLQLFPYRPGVSQSMCLPRFKHSMLLLYQGFLALSQLPATTVVNYGCDTLPPLDTLKHSGASPSAH